MNKTPTYIRNEYGRLERRIVTYSSEEVMTRRGYGYPGWLTRKGKREQVFVLPSFGVVVYESHPDFCDECGLRVIRETGFCKKGHPGPQLAHIHDKPEYGLKENVDHTGTPHCAQCGERKIAHPQQTGHEWVARTDGR